MQSYLHDFNILAVRAALCQLHILNGLRRDELGMSGYALATELGSHPGQGPTCGQERKDMFGEVVLPIAGSDIKLSFSGLSTFSVKILYWSKLPKSIFME